MEALTKKVSQLNQDFQVLVGSTETIWKNQKELTKSQGLLDEQFAVSTRMSVMGLNELFGVAHPNRTMRIDEKDIETLFRDWAAFRARPDFRDFMMEWMLGMPLDKLPPPPEPPAKKEGEADAKSDNGDENPEQELAESGATGQENDVPEVQKEDSASG